MNLNARIRRIEQAIEKGYRTGKLPLHNRAAEEYRRDVTLAAIRLLVDGKPLPDGLSEREARCARRCGAMIRLSRGLTPPPGLTPEDLAEAEKYAPAFALMEKYPCPRG